MQYSHGDIKASQDIMELFIQAVHKYNALEKIPPKVGSKHELYHSERHFLDKIGDYPRMNVTEFAETAGITVFFRVKNDESFLSSCVQQLTICTHKGDFQRSKELSGCQVQRIESPKALSFNQF